MTGLIIGLSTLKLDAGHYIPSFSCGSQAPAKPRSPVGQMVTYYLKMEPHLFKDALDEQFRRLKDEKDEAAKLAKQQQGEQKEKQAQDKGKASSGEVVLYQ